MTPAESIAFVCAAFAAGVSVGIVAWLVKLTTGGIGR